MLNVLLERLRQGHRTVAWPRGAPILPDRYRGRPVLAADLTAEGAADALAACPTGALRTDADGRVRLDLGACLYCGACAEACPDGIRFGRQFQQAAARRDDLVLAPGNDEHALAAALHAEAARVFGRSLKLRQVSAGGCNACEADTNVLSTIVFDLGRFGIQFVAAPRHADGLLITGPVTHNMRQALRQTWEAVPAPRIVIAVGACAIAGGPFRDHPEVTNGAAATVPVDLYIPGCPPHPLTILDGMLRLLGRL